MLYKEDKLINTLIKNQNYNCASDCVDLFSPSDYYKILNEGTNCEKDILSNMREIVDIGFSTGIVAVCGNSKTNRSFSFGFTDSKGSHQVNNDTIFDLASLTKTFLCLCYFKLYDKGLVDFDRPICYYSNEFTNIKSLTLRALMHFSCEIVTDRKITDTNTDEAVSLIKSSKIKNNIPTYSDIPAIILGMLFEKISSAKFEDFLTSEVIVPFELKNTFWNSNGIESENYMNYDNEFIYLNGNLQKLQNRKFQVHDQKARILSEDGKHLCGHAGLFSTAADISKLCTALLNEKVISEQALNLIGSNSLSRPQQRFGFLSYVKNPSIKDSEVYWAMSGNSFAISGFTGTYLMIDPRNKTFCFIGGNKINNKLTKCDDLDFLKKTDLCYSKDFIYRKDALRDSLCNLSLATLN